MPGAWESATNRAVGRGKQDRQHSTRPEITAGRPSRRGFPSPNLRYYHGQPSLLAVALGLPWTAHREAA